MNEILLSVVIPTFNRYKYLKVVIDSFKNINSERIEFIIQDNTKDNSEILEYMKGNKDTRIKYFHKPDHVDITVNCDLAVSHAIGKYICMLGDDDTICSKMLRAAAFCDENDIEACCFQIPGFNWPDMTFEGQGASRKEANFFVRDKADGGVYIIDPKREIKISLREGGWLYLTMPRVYHQMVSRECLERIYKRVNTYFPGPSPDMANSVCVCLESKKTVYLNDYLIISGYGYKSATGQGNRGEHFGNLKEKAWLPNNILEIWNPEIPAIFSAETIWAQSLTQALKEYGAIDYLNIFSYSSLYASFIKNHISAKNQFFAFCNKKPYRYIRTLVGAVKKALIRFERKRVLPKKNFIDRNDINSLLDAQKYCEELSDSVPVYHFEEDSERRGDKTKRVISRIRRL